MRFHVFRIPIAAVAALTGLIACNTPDSPVTSTSDDPDEGRYHEKSFSWSESSGGLPKASALAGIAGRQTGFATQEALVEAVKTLDEKLKNHNFTDSLWKPVDYACDELDLAVWNEYGTVTLGDSVVFDEGILKSRCRLSEGIEEAADSALGKVSSEFGPSELSDRQFPYKMIGRSWTNDYVGVYKSTGGETQFEKRRERFGITAWYDTDATRIGVRTYLIDCSEFSPRECSIHHELHDWDKNDDYVSERELVIGAGIRNYYPSPDNGWTTAREVYIPVNYAKSFRIAAACISLHSVDHAGLLFRATTSSGIGSSPVYSNNFASLDYVTW
jgi:hypothetical protein